MLVRPPMMDLKMTVRDNCAVFACSSHNSQSLSVKKFWCRVAGVGFWTDFHHHPPHQLPASKIKQTFLSSNLDCSLAFWTASGRTPHSFGNIMTFDVYTSTFPKQILLFMIFISRFPNICETQVNGIYWNHVSYKNGLPWWLSDKESGSVVRNLPANAGDAGSIPGWGRSPEENGNPSSILSWKISWTLEPGGLQFMGLQRVGHDAVTKQQQHHTKVLKSYK